MVSMFPANFSKEQMVVHIESADSDEYARFLYCFHMGFTYIGLNALEDRIISVMTMCDAIQVKSVLKDDARAWEVLREKRGTLEASTLGSLIKILGRHIVEEDAQYLAFVKEKRDQFIHRFFRKGEWPGDLNADGCKAAIRRLIAMNIIFRRATTRFIDVLARNKLIIKEPMTHRGESGFLIMSPNFLEKIFGE